MWDWNGCTPSRVADRGCSQRPSQALLFSLLGHLGLPTPPWWVPGQHPSRNIMVRPRSEDIPATDLQPNGSLISVSSSLKHPVTAIKDSSPPLLSHPRPLPATVTVRWPWLSFPLSLSNCKPETLRGVSVSECPGHSAPCGKHFILRTRAKCHDHNSSLTQDETSSPKCLLEKGQGEEFSILSLMASQVWIRPSLLNCWEKMTC